MKIIGLLGGMSWESTAEYYRIINEATKQALGPSHSAPCLMYSFDFYEIEHLQHQDKWDILEQLLSSKAKKLKEAGTDVLVICTNTMHIMADQIQANSGVYVLHIVDCVAQAILEKGLKRVLLLGTAFTMNHKMYPTILDRHHIHVVTPNQNDQAVIHRIIYDELIHGEFFDQSRDVILNIISKYSDIEGVILGCTELPLLINNHDVNIALFNTTKIHALAAVNYALGNESKNIK
jgi:aspartate racemase